jgi:hypothetical protein
MKFNDSRNISKNSELDIIKIMVYQEIRIRKDYDVLLLQEGSDFMTTIPP